MTYPLHTPGLHIRSRSITSSMLMTTYSNVVVSNDQKQSVSVAFQYVVALPYSVWQGLLFFANIIKYYISSAKSRFVFHHILIIAVFLLPECYSTILC